MRRKGRLALGLQGAVRWLPGLQLGVKGGEAPVKPSLKFQQVFGKSRRLQRCATVRGVCVFCFLVSFGLLCPHEPGDLPAQNDRLV